MNIKFNKFRLNTANIRIKSLRSKVMLGFLALVALLLFSSVVSLVELRHIGWQTQTILAESNRNMTLAGDLLDAVEEQNHALQQMFLRGDMTYDTVYSKRLSDLSARLNLAREQQTVGIDSVESAFENYTDVAKFYRIRSAIGDVEWYSTDYAEAYRKLIAAIRDYMESSQVALGPQALAIEHNAYRAITPSVITIGVILVIVLMLWYFLDMYGVQTVTKVNRALGDYLKYGILYNAKVKGNDDIEELSARIEELIARTEKGNR